jgi:hypothetical protein
MPNRAILALFLLLAGCGNPAFSSRLSILHARLDGPGTPRYLDKRESSVELNHPFPAVKRASANALAILGCSKISEDRVALRGDRAFTLGFACGVGGETLCVTIEPTGREACSVHVVSYKRFPYPAAPQFLDAEYLALLQNLLDDPFRSQLL